MTNILILLATVWLLVVSITAADNETISSQQPVVNHLRKVEEDDENAILPSSSGSTTSFNEQQSQSIFINQSNNMYILAKYGQTINLPCIIYRLRNPDLVNVHAIWHKLVDKHRPIVLSIGMQQLKQDMRYRVKVINMNKTKSQHGQHHHHAMLLPSTIDTTNSDDSLEVAGSGSHHNHHHSSSRKYLIQNWSFEIRKLTYEDSGTYQCLLPLVKPITKNITLQVIPDLVVEPRDATFKIDEKIRLTCRTTLRSSHQKKHHHAHQATRQQRPGILWYKDNEPIRSSSSSYRSSSSPDGVAVAAVDQSDRQIEIETKQEEEDNGDEALLLNSVLTIHNARIDDAGKYKCIYENIQEQVTVKVIYDYFEYKNFLSSSASKSSKTGATRLTLTQMAIFFVLCLYLLSSVI